MAAKMAATRLCFIILCNLFFRSSFSLGIQEGKYPEEGEDTDVKDYEDGYEEVNTVDEDEQQNESITTDNLAEQAVVENDTLNVIDSSTNKTEPLWNCKMFNLSEQSVVILDDNNSLISWLEDINRTTSCAVVLFYAKWCYFSSMLAPAYNAIGRAFKGLPVLAVDAYTYNSLNTRYGIAGVPTIILFHGAKPVARFNRTRTFEDLLEFIHQSTGLEYNSSVKVSEQDYHGPLSSTPSEDYNYYLIASSLFIACVGLMCLWHLQYVQMLWGYLTSWPVVSRLFLSGQGEKED